MFSQHESKNTLGHVLSLSALSGGIKFKIKCWAFPHISCGCYDTAATCTQKLFGKRSTVQRSTAAALLMTW